MNEGMGTVAVENGLGWFSWALQLKWWYVQVQRRRGGPGREVGSGLPSFFLSSPASIPIISPVDRNRVPVSASAAAISTAVRLKFYIIS